MYNSIGETEREQVSESLVKPVFIVAFFCRQIQH